MLLLAGDLDVGEDAFTGTACVWVSPDEGPAVLSAGPRGAEVLVLQFPRQGSDGRAA